MLMLLLEFKACIQKNKTNILNMLLRQKQKTNFFFNLVNQEIRLGGWLDGWMDGWMERIKVLTNLD